MIRHCSQSDKQSIVSYIGSEYYKCLYLYLDLEKYGFDQDEVDVYVQTAGEKISSVLLKYYSCLHVYSKDDSFDAKELAAFIDGNSFKLIYCAASTAEHIYANMSQIVKDSASKTTGWVAQIEKTDKKSEGLATEAASEDFAQIASLILGDEDISRSYKSDELERQLLERSREGYARNYVIKQDGLVIAHACTNAELGNIAVVAELLVRSEYRRRGLASEIWRYICETLLAEGKEVYSFYYSEESRALHRKIGFREVCEWCKIVFN